MSKNQKILRGAVILLGGAVVLMLGWRLTSLKKRQAIPQPLVLPLADYGTVGDFTLTERSGETVQRKDLSGSVWVANFIFTRCTGPCPMITMKMSQLQKEFLGTPQLKLVSFTVDPEHDSPEILTEYADNYGADKKFWVFLTGNTDDVYSLIRNNFHLAVQENADPNAPPGEEVNHSLHFALVDQHSTIRGFYVGTDSESMDQLKSHIRKLLS